MQLLHTTYIIHVVLLNESIRTLSPSFHILQILYARQEHSWYTRVYENP